MSGLKNRLPMFLDQIHAIRRMWMRGPVPVMDELVHLCFVFFQNFIIYKWEWSGSTLNYRFL